MIDLDDKKPQQVRLIACMLFSSLLQWNNWERAVHNSTHLAFLSRVDCVLQGLGELYEQDYVQAATGFMDDKVRPLVSCDTRWHTTQVCIHATMPASSSAAAG
jgi:hypothetical protein